MISSCLCVVHDRGTEHGLFTDTATPSAHSNRIEYNNAEVDVADVEFDFEFESEDQTVTWTVNLSYSVYRDRKYGADADGNRGTDMSWIEPDDITILDQHLEDITFYVRESNPKLYKKIESLAEDMASQQDDGPHYDEDAWKGYD